MSIYPLLFDSNGVSVDLLYAPKGISPLSGDFYGNLASLPTAPVISSAPTISGWDDEGATLTAVSSGVSGNPTPTITWQWKRGGVNIAGATNQTYTLVSADVGNTITVEQTATNSEGSDTSTSAATASITVPKFRFTVRTTSESESFTITCANKGTFNATVDWGDGSSSTITTYNDVDLSHTYALAGDHDIKITGTFPNVLFDGAADRNKITQIEQLGKVGWTTLASAFRDCDGLITFKSGICDLSGVTDTSGFIRMFEICSNITYADWTGASGANSVTNCSLIHNGCVKLNYCDVTDLPVNAVRVANNCFVNCGDLDLVGLDAWNISAFTSMVNIAGGTTKIPTANYDDVLIAWDAQAPVNALSTSFGNSTYTSGGAAEAARTSLINTYGWTIADGGVAP